ncbi:RIP metalloprotease RseP [Loktanella sp. Alg231-35]|uniref:RIP metalloprotease RseP n=1 Tax=Loktanella sp. Alg231-35 TaxID=1922220 RepID=UPI00131F2506|nr:RIP metalloprotease RseP [Loktanella sp. Alg231-35]
MIDIFAVFFGVILTFLIVVVLHELGHFFAARLVGVKPEIFSVGFGKPIWSRKDRHGIIWQVSRIPAGGYVRFVGDENAASLSSVADGPVIDGSLKAASKSAQAFVAIAGPLANVIFTVVALSVLPFMSGVTAYPWTVAHVTLSSDVTGLRVGDQIVAVADADIQSQDTLSSVLTGLPAHSEVTYQIVRDGSPRAELAPRPDLPLIGNVAVGSAAFEAGMQAGDLLQTIDGQTVNAWSDLQRIVAASNGDPMTIVYDRQGVPMTTQITARQSDGRWLIGVGGLPLFTLATERPAFGDAVQSGVSRSWDLLTNLVTGLAGSLTGQNDSCDLDGPIQIASVAGQAIQLGPETFLLFLAIISLGLGVLNLLPVPILDGGHLMLLGYEGATGRPLGKKMQAVLFIGGVTIIVFLMLTATVNDLTC